MTDWTAGYVADIGYTYGYYTELNPLRVRLAFLNAGLNKKDTHFNWAFIWPAWHRRYKKDT